MENLSIGMAVELKPCPFCGDNFPKVKSFYLKKKDKYRASVECEKCGGRVVCAKRENADGLRYAVKVWNKREN